MWELNGEKKRAVDTLKFGLHPKQRFALNTKATEVLWGGAAGGGKSQLLRFASIIWAASIPNLQIYFFRRLYPDLVRTHIEGPQGYKQLLKEWVDKGYVQIVEGEVRFLFNGSKIYLCHCKDEADKYNYLSIDIHVLLVDELTTFPESVYRFLRSRVRATNIVIPERYKDYFPRILCASNPVGVGHCVPFGEVLTPGGWKDIRDFNPGDMVFTVDKQGYLKTTKVAQVYQSHHNGEMAVIKRGSLNIIATPDHKVPKTMGTRQNPNSPFSLIPINKLPGESYLLRSVNWQGVELKGIEISNIEKRIKKIPQPLWMSGNNYCEFMGWFLSEGCSIKKLGLFQISQQKKENIPLISNLAKKIGFKGRWDKSGYTVYSRSWVNFLSQFGKSREKFIPQNIKEASLPQLKIFFNAAMAGDGHWVKPNRSGQYYTISKQLADDMAEIALKLGYVVYQKQRQRENRLGLSYEVCFKTNFNKSSIILTGQHRYDVSTKIHAKTHVKYEPFNGPIYCLGIPETHTFIIRQNGSIWISGNTWVKKTWIDGKQEGEVYQADEDEGGMTRQFIRATIKDNPTLMQVDPKYITRLKGLGSKELVRAYLEGSWDTVIGAYFPEFTLAHQIEPFTLKRHWTRFRAFDWGYSAPFCVLWLTVVSEAVIAKNVLQEDITIPAGAIIIYREWLGENEQGGGLRLTPQEIAQGIHDREEDTETTYGVADSAIFVQDGGPSIAEKFMQSNVFFFKADKRRVPGWTELRSRLTGSEGTPMLFMFKTCTKLIRDLPSLQHSEKDPEDCESDGVCDHGADALRYALMSRPYISKAQEEIGDFWNKKITAPLYPTLDELWAEHKRERSGQDFFRGLSK